MQRTGARKRRKGHDEGDGREKEGVTARGSKAGRFIYFYACLLILLGNFFEDIYVLTPKTTGEMQAGNWRLRCLGLSDVKHTNCKQMLGFLEGGNWKLI